MTKGKTVRHSHLKNHSSNLYNTHNICCGGPNPYKNESYYLSDIFCRKNLRAGSEIRWILECNGLSEVLFVIFQKIEIRLLIRIFDYKYLEFG